MIKNLIARLFGMNKIRIEDAVPVQIRRMVCAPIVFRQAITPYEICISHWVETGEISLQKADFDISAYARVVHDVAVVTEGVKYMTANFRIANDEMVIFANHQKDLSRMNIQEWAQRQHDLAINYLSGCMTQASIDGEPMPADIQKVSVF